jgi:hypothetical protein
MADNSTSTAPLIFPLGHYLGADVGASGTDEPSHVVRIGWQLHRLADNDQLAAWALAHGLPAPSQGEPAPWTRSALEGAARAGGNSNISGALDDLIERDLVLEVMPDSPEAVEFAKACRTRSLLIGLGNSADEPLLYGIGAAQNVPAVRVPGFAYELWKWGHACDSLWHACQVLAAADGAANLEQSDPERVLSRCLAAIQVLLAHGAMYLDEAREDSLEVERVD